MGIVGRLLALRVGLLVGASLGNIGEDVSVVHRDVLIPVEVVVEALDPKPGVMPVCVGDPGLPYGIIATSRATSAAAALSVKVPSRIVVGQEVRAWCRWRRRGPATHRCRSQGRRRRRRSVPRSSAGRSRHWCSARSAGGRGDVGEIGPENRLQAGLAAAARGSTTVDGGTGEAARRRARPQPVAARRGIRQREQEGASRDHGSWPVSPARQTGGGQLLHDSSVAVVLDGEVAVIAHPVLDGRAGMGRLGQEVQVDRLGVPVAEEGVDAPGAARRASRPPPASAEMPSCQWSAGPPLAGARRPRRTGRNSGCS